MESKSTPVGLQVESKWTPVSSQVWNPFLSLYRFILSQWEKNTKSPVVLMQNDGQGDYDEQDIVAPDVLMIGVAMAG